jgi:hypothetical protein
MSEFNIDNEEKGLKENSQNGLWVNYEEYNISDCNAV